MEDLALIFPYTATELTDQVDRIPNLYGLVGELDLFPEEGSISRIVELRYENHQLRVLPAKDRGTPGTPAQTRTGSTVFIEIPHFPELDLITPKDIQDILIQINQTKRLTTVAEEVAKRLIDIKRAHDITLEWLRCSALQGIVLDGNSQQLLDLYGALGVNKTTVDFDLGNDAADMTAKCQALFQDVTVNLKGESMRGVEAIVDPTFFQRFVTHTSVKQYYLQAEQAVQLAQMLRRERGGNMWGREWRFANVLFREYYGTAPVRANPTAGITSTPFWAANSGTAYPVGTAKMFRTYFAPADDLRTANTRGNAVHISPKFLDHGEGIELKSQSNPLPICRRPEAVIQLISNS